MKSKEKKEDRENHKESSSHESWENEMDGTIKAK